MAPVQEVASQAEEHDCRLLYGDNQWPESVKCTPEPKQQKSQFEVEQWASAKWHSLWSTKGSGHLRVNEI